MDRRLIFFSEKKLARKLRDGLVSQKEQMIYLLLINIFIAVLASSAFGHFAYSGTTLNNYDYLIDAVMILAVVLTTLFTSRINNKGDSRDFITRTMCLSIPAMIKGIIFGALIGAAAIALDIQIVYDGNWSYEESSFGPFTLAAMIITYVFIYWRLVIGFKIASGQVT